MIGRKIWIEREIGEKRERQERENKKREWLKCFSSLSLVSAGTKGWTREKILNIIPNQCTQTESEKLCQNIIETRRTQYF